MNWFEKNLLDIKIRKSLFEFAYCLFLFETIFQYSKYGVMEEIHILFPALRIMAYAVLLFKLMLDFIAREFSPKEMAFVVLVGVPLAISGYVTGNKNLLIYWAFIVGANNIDLERIIKLSLIVHAVTILFVVFSCYAGVIENQIYYRNSVEQTGRRDSFGFEYTTEITNQFFYMVLMWIYLRKEKIKPVEWLLMVLIIIFLYVKTDTKNATALGLAAILESVILKYSVYVRKYHKWYAVLAVGIFPLVACFIIWASYNYSGEGVLWQKFNEIISGRLSLGRSGILNYGVKPWGQPMVWVGGTPGDGAAYNYVDSSYVQMLINFGPIILAMILAGAMAVGVALTKKGDTYLLLVLGIIAIHTTFDPQLMWIGYNTFVMMYSYFKKKEPLRDETEKLSCI